MTEPEDLEEDLFADLYEADDNAQPTTAPSAAPAPAPVESLPLADTAAPNAATGTPALSTPPAPAVYGNHQVDLMDTQPEQQMSWGVQSQNGANQQPLMSHDTEHASSSVATESQGTGIKEDG
ncbi:hypothetical protein AJ80_07220 [Polytolypa hystricis UAMH7299]|uniref:Uncharacterized protein n=1 Tax=Polytolypa hystricis (strain UAMH7299) TaxID=1447883 RepID=A0A2B7XQI9_POLH7|nr:hypothetical protein AJ80_07220 [Polytolypa hystricis UAMH7299]